MFVIFCTGIIVIFCTGIIVIFRTLILLILFVKNFVSCPFVKFSVEGIIRLVTCFRLIPVLLLTYVHNIFYQCVVSTAHVTTSTIPLF